MNYKIYVNGEIDTIEQALNDAKVIQGKLKREYPFLVIKSDGSIQQFWDMREFVSADYEEVSPVQLITKCEEIIESKKFKMYDSVLVRDSNTDTWKIGIFKYYIPDSLYKYKCFINSFTQCILLNEDTEKLLGTTDNYTK